MSVRRAFVATLLVPLVLLSACSDDDPVPQMPDPTTSEPSPTETSSTAAPETPEEFIRRWAAAEAEMERSGDTNSYRELSARCQSCLELADLVEGYYAAGGYVQWEGWSIRRVRPYPAGGENAFAVKVASPPTKYKESKSGEVQTFPGGLATHILTLDSVDDTWVVIGKAELQ